jgi:hypothetical protein
MDFYACLSDSSRLCVEQGVIAVGDDPKLFRELLDFCFSCRYPWSMRAARVVQMHCEYRPESIFPYLEEILPKVLATKEEGVIRSFLKIFADSIPIERIPEPGLLLSFCFDKLMNMGVNPAIKIYAIDIIIKFVKQEPDLLIELKARLEFIMPESPPSIQSKGRKILKKRNANLIS